MRFKATIPDEEMLIATHEQSGVKVYAYTSANPFYVTVRIIGPASSAKPKRRSFWLGFDIEQSRWTGVPDRRIIDTAVAEWAAPIVRAAYPDMAEASGCNPAELEELRAEQAAKKAARKKA